MPGLGDEELGDEELGDDAFTFGSCAYLTCGNFAAGALGCAVRLCDPVLTGTCATKRGPD